MSKQNTKPVHMSGSLSVSLLNAELRRRFDELNDSEPGFVGFVREVNRELQNNIEEFNTAQLESSDPRPRLADSLTLERTLSSPVARIEIGVKVENLPEEEILNMARTVENIMSVVTEIVTAYIDDPFGEKARHYQEARRKLCDELAKGREGMSDMLYESPLPLDALKNAVIVESDQMYSLFSGLTN